MAQFCKICNGQRETIVLGGKKCCEGCGSHVANAHLTEQQLKAAKGRQQPKCPRCGSSNSHVLEPGRFECGECFSVFEPVEQGYLDTGPDRNAEKKERKQ